MITAMKLEDLGYNNEKAIFSNQQFADNFETGRVIAEHKERYIVVTAKGEVEAEVTGNMRFTATGREDFPAVGDWVAVTLYDEDFAIIHKIFPRTSVIRRQAAGHKGEVQVIAANVDCAFIIQSADRDFNINRLERYLIICNSAGVAPCIVITKTDLADEQRVHELTESIRLRIQNVPVITISNETRDGYDRINSLIEKGKTYCMLGSSGVGKSTLLNNLSGENYMRTDTISQSTNKGRHTTSHRELIILDNGGILIDNPGMREVGIADAAGGFETTFDLITRLSEGCRFKNCTHTGEAGCAVMEAVGSGEIDMDSYENYLKMEREKSWFETTVADKKRRDKIFGKVIKNYYKSDYKRKI
jgi:ribosome biogenesis GTPase / thiamine phosphate phosphatase